MSSPHKRNRFMTSKSAWEQSNQPSEAQNYSSILTNPAPTPPFPDSILFMQIGFNAPDAQEFVQFLNMQREFAKDSIGYSITQLMKCIEECLKNTNEAKIQCDALQRSHDSLSTRVSELEEIVASQRTVHEELTARLEYTENFVVPGLEESLRTQMEKYEGLSGMVSEMDTNNSLVSELEEETRHLKQTISILEKNAKQDRRLREAMEQKINACATLFQVRNTTLIPTSILIPIHTGPS